MGIVKQFGCLARGIPKLFPRDPRLQKGVHKTDLDHVLKGQSDSAIDRLEVRRPNRFGTMSFAFCRLKRVACYPPLYPRRRHTCKGCRFGYSVNTDTKGEIGRASCRERV